MLAAGSPTQLRTSTAARRALGCAAGHSPCLAHGTDHRPRSPDHEPARRSTPLPLDTASRGTNATATPHHPPEHDATHVVARTRSCKERSARLVEAPTRLGAPLRATPRPRRTGT